MPHHPRARLVAALTLSALAACAAPPTDLPGARLQIAVAPLDLPGVTDATYTLTVSNALGATVWTRTLTSTAYGDGTGALSYVGPCDADPTAAAHTIALALDELRTASGPLVSGVDYHNPAPTADPVTLTRTCLPDADVPVTFDLTVARAATQGFFDVAITFNDIFCSAKLDCERAPGQPLELLADASGARRLTAVLGFACTAGPDTATTLWLDPVTVTCTGGGPFTVNPAAGPGNLNPPFTDPTHDLLFQAATYRGAELLDATTAWNKAYWNVALGLNASAFAALGACTLTAAATASDGPFPGGATPAGTRWPLVTWSVPLVTAGARACTSHALDVPGSGVATAYTPTAGRPFASAYQRGPGLIAAAPDGSTLSCTPTTLAPAETATCTVAPTFGGAPVASPATAFTLSASAGSVSPLAPAYGASFTFTFTAPAQDGPVTVGDGFSTATLTVDAPLPPAGSTPALAGYDCQSLLEQGVNVSGVYWIDPTGAAPFQTWCEQTAHGGGWTLLFNSVGDPAGQTRAFWAIPYAQRLVAKGTPALTANFYAPSLYRDARVYLDVAEDTGGTVAELFRATGAGLNEATMAIADPALTAGHALVYGQQLASGWAAADFDMDLHTGANCAASYGTTQHLAACWRYSLGSDGDAPYADGGWGPHLYKDDAAAAGLAGDGTDYARLRRISRFVKLCHGPGCMAATAGASCAALRTAGAVTNGVYWIDPTGANPFRVYCDQTTQGGGWAAVYSSVGDPGGATTAFWQIPYAQRLTPKGGVGLGANSYDPRLYAWGTQYMDIIEDLMRTTAVDFVASTTGLNTTTMRFANPALISGGGGYSCQFAAGWASTDYDNDTYGSNCASAYSSVTQHYCACWHSNLGSDADPPLLDGGWGPHVANPHTTNGLYTDGSVYSRVRRITRYTRW